MNSGQVPTDIGDVSEEGLDWRDKGLPPGQAIALADLAQQGWNILAGDAGSPVAVLRQSALDPQPGDDARLL